MWHTSHCTGRWGPVAASLRHPWGRPHWQWQQTGWLPDMCRGVDPPRCGTLWGDWAFHSECVYRTPKNVKRLYLVLHNIRVSVNIYLQFYISTIYLINGAFLILLFGSFQLQLYMECSSGGQIWKSLGRYISCKNILSCTYLLPPAAEEIVRRFLCGTFSGSLNTATLSVLVGTQRLGRWRASCPH